MKLTSDDLARAANLGMDQAEEANGSGKILATLFSDALWKAVMGAAGRSDYPTDSVTQLRDAYDHGRMDYY